MSRAAGGPAGRLRRPTSAGVLASLERRGDFQALAAAYLADGDPVSAELFLRRVKPSAQTDADRAAIALERGDFLGALRLADGALARGGPFQAEAAFNRAVALERLDRRREAAAQFRALTTTSEPGWAREAQRHLDRLKDGTPP